MKHDNLKVAEFEHVDPFWLVFVRFNNIHSCDSCVFFFFVFVSLVLLCAHIVDIYQVFQGWILCWNTQLMSLSGIPDRWTTHQDDAGKWLSLTHWWPAWLWEKGYLSHRIHACWLEWHIVIVVPIMCYTELTYMQCLTLLQYFFELNLFWPDKVNAFHGGMHNDIPQCVFRIGRQSKRETHSMSLKVFLGALFDSYTICIHMHPYTHTSSNHLLRFVHPVSTGGLFKQRSQVGMGGVGIGGEYPKIHDMKLWLPVQ